MKNQKAKTNEEFTIHVSGTTKLDILHARNLYSPENRQ